MGYDSTRFVGEVDEELHCLICSMVLEDPVNTPCDHSFCNDCIKQWLTLNAVCPVDRQSLKITDLKPSERIIRNLLDKLMIKCDFQKQGCKWIVPLENLENHLNICEHNPNSEIICDKGCNLRIKRCEYEVINCFMHLSNRVAEQEKEIIRLTHELSNQKEEFKRTFNRALTQQKVENVKLREEVRSLNEQMGTTFSTPKQIEIKNRSLKWQKVNGIKISTGELNILEGCIGRIGFAQLCYPLDSSNSFFKVEYLSSYLNGDIGIGLSSLQVKGSIIYSNNGKLNGAGIFKDRDVPALDAGDVIECRIEHTYNSNSNGSYNVELYFYKNGEFILKELVKMPSDGFYPIIHMNGNCKIKFLIH